MVDLIEEQGDERVSRSNKVFLASIWCGPAVREQEEEENPTVRGVSFRDHRIDGDNQIRSEKVDRSKIKGGLPTTSTAGRRGGTRFLFSGPWPSKIKEVKRFDPITIIIIDLDSTST